MSQFFVIHPENPQPRLIQQAADILDKGGVVVYPTDSIYAIGCHLGDKDSLLRIRKIRELDEHHHFTLMCRDLSELGTYAQVSNPAYRILKGLTPGPFTFILKATREVPRRLQHPKKKTIGLRVPDNAIVQALLAAHGAPLMTTTLTIPAEESYTLEPYEMHEALEHHVDLVIDGGPCGVELTTVIDLSGDTPSIIRQGKGDCSRFI